MTDKKEAVINSNDSGQETSRLSFFRRSDWWILLVLVLGLGTYMLWTGLLKPRLFPDESASYAWIYHEDMLLEKVALDGSVKTWTLTVPGQSAIQMTLQTYPDRSIRVKEANCPDLICVHTGRVRIKGQSIACLPNRIFIKIGSIDSPGSGAQVDG